MLQLESILGKKKFAILTLGCKVNQSESESLYSALVSLGLVHSDAFLDAELVFINTCAVTKEAEAKTRKAVRKALKSGASAVVVMGCASELVKESIASERKNKEVEVWFLSNSEKKKLIYSLESTASSSSTDQSFYHFRTRAFVKIQDGCNQRCSYCIVPFVRGREESLGKELIFKRLQKIQEQGIKEVVLTGIHLGRYSQNLNRKKYGLADLLKDIARNFDFRIRLSSIDVFEIDERLLEVLYELKPKVCPHFHVPLQSGSDRILKLMRRPYTSSYFLERIEELKKIDGIVAVSTDVMVGFPSETEEDFEKTVELVEEVGFMKLHVFRYSRRPGTEALNLGPQVEEQVKKEREAVLLEASRKLSDKFKRMLDGKTAHALIERKVGPFWVGKTEYYVDVKISTPVKQNEVYKVKIKYDGKSDVFGEVME